MFFLAGARPGQGELAGCTGPRSAKRTQGPLCPCASPTAPQLGALRAAPHAAFSPFTINIQSTPDCCGWRRSVHFHDAGWVPKNCVRAEHLFSRRFWNCQSSLFVQDPGCFHGKNRFLQSRSLQSKTDSQE